MLSLYICSFGRCPLKSVTPLMVINFIQYSLMISPENVNLDKTKLKNLNNFKYSSFNYTLLPIFSIITKKLREVQHRLIKT